MTTTGSKADEIEACAVALEKAFFDQDLADLYHDDVVAWHNYTDKTATKTEILGMVAGMFSDLAKRGYSRPQYVNIRRVHIPNGFMQQHVVEATRGDEVFRLPICLIAEVRDGKISKQDEYVDTAPYVRMVTQD